MKALRVWQEPEDVDGRQVSVEVEHLGQSALIRVSLERLMPEHLRPVLATVRRVLIKRALGPRRRA